MNETNTRAYYTVMCPRDGRFSGCCAGECRPRGDYSVAAGAETCKPGVHRDGLSLSVRLPRCRSPRCLLGLRRAYLVWPILLLLLVGAALTALLPPAEDQGGIDVLGALRRATSRKESPARGRAEEEEEEEEQRFTIVIQTYNRTDILLKLLNHYQAVPHLQQIIIVWNNIGKQTPLKLWKSLQPHPVPVVFKEQASNLMRNRLQAFPEIDTDGQCVFQLACCVSFEFRLFNMVKPMSCACFNSLFFF